MEIYKTNPLRITSHSTVSISPVTHTSDTPSPVFPPLGDWTLFREKHHNKPLHPQVASAKENVFLSKSFIFWFVVKKCGVVV